MWPQFHGHRVWGASAGDFLGWKRQGTVFEDLTAFDSQSSSFNLDYQIIGVPFLLGRNFLDEEGTTDKEHVVILTHKLWKRMGADSGIVGQPQCDLRLPWQEIVLQEVAASYVPAWRAAKVDPTVAGDVVWLEATYTGS